MKKEIIATGIDTIGFQYAEFANTEKIETDVTVLDTKITYTKVGEKNIPFKPSKALNGGVKLTTIKESLEYMEQLEDLTIKYNEKGLLIRVDIATDFNFMLDDKMQLFRLFLETMALKRKKESSTVFETTKEITEKGNLKIKGRFNATTAYSCNDKDRIALSRLENKIDIRTTTGTTEDKIEVAVKKYIEELMALDSLVEKVEDRYINKLYSYYKELIEVKKEIRNFTDFVVVANVNKWILTPSILKGLMKKVGLKSSYKSFNQKFTNTRTITTTSKAELKELTGIVIKQLKEQLKELKIEKKS